jgi:hypothetical protein
MAVEMYGARHRRGRRRPNSGEKGWQRPALGRGEPAAAGLGRRRQRQSDAGSRGGAGVDRGRRSSRGGWVCILSKEMRVRLVRAGTRAIIGFC